MLLFYHFYFCCATYFNYSYAAGQTGNLDWLKKDLVKARTELQMAKMDLGEFDEESDQGSFITFDLIDIHSALPDHPKTAALVQSLKEKHLHPLQYLQDLELLHFEL